MCGRRKITKRCRSGFQVNVERRKKNKRERNETEMESSDREMMEGEE